MGISIIDDIKSITDLKRNTNKILQQVHATGRPVVLTINGKAEAVLLGAKEFEKMTNALAMLKMLVPAENDVKTGATTNAATFFKDFRHDKKI
jgi:prevent-host-death family protein